MVVVIALKKTMASKGIEVEELAEKTGLSKAMLWSYGSGRRNPTPETLFPLFFKVYLTFEA